MDRRSWLWRRKSSEKSPDESESSTSISSHSEKFSDDQVYSNHNTQSQEVTSKIASSYEDVNSTVKTLTEKLSAALLNISAKEDLVNQHARVAEEAVSGWEKADMEVIALKQQLEALNQKNSALEDRVGHLDGALKECVRQIRQAREQQEQNINEVVTKKTHELESEKTELRSQVIELQSQLQAAKDEALTSIHSDLHLKLEAAEKEISFHKLALLSRAEELELRTIERDLSTLAAEAASKQYLDSIKKVTKLEAECRKLRAAARKSFPANDQRSVTASVFVESFTDSQSDSGDRLLAVETDTNKICGFETNECEKSLKESDQFKSEKSFGKNIMVPSVEINLMDDFLEMERLAALPEIETESCPDLVALSYQPHGFENHLKSELEVMINRTAELEEKLEKIEMEKSELEMVLSECQVQLNSSRHCLKEAEIKCLELQNQLTLVNEATRVTEIELDNTNVKLLESADQLKEAEVKLVELQTQLSMAQEAKILTDVELKDTNAKLNTSKECLEEAKLELTELQTQLAVANEARSAVEADVEAKNLMKEEAESQLVVLKAELNTLISRVGSLEQEIEKERALSNETVSKCGKLEDEILRMQSEKELRKAASTNGDWRIKQDKELALAATKFAECQKTIASLCQQLKSHSTLDDLWIEDSKTCKENLHCPLGDLEPLKLYSGDSYQLTGDFEAKLLHNDFSAPLENDRIRGSLLAGRVAVTSENIRNGFVKLFPRSKSRDQNQNLQE